MRFTTRDLLWLMVVVGLACVWCGERQAWESQRNVLLPRIADLDEIKKFLGGDEPPKRFVESARVSNSRPPRPPSTTVIPVKPEDRILKPKPERRPRNEA